MQGALVNFYLKKDLLNPFQLGYEKTNKYLDEIISIPSAIGTTMLKFIGQNYSIKEFKSIKEGIKKFFGNFSFRLNYLNYYHTALMY